jgi:DNA-binding transcriptional ArsR family regulator
MSAIDPVFAALADPTRRRIVETLSGGDARSVNDIAQHFDISRQAVAKHLNVLREAGIVRGEPRGRQHLHALAPETLSTLTEWVDHYGQFWNDRLATLKKLAEEDKRHGRH